MKSILTYSLIIYTQHKQAIVEHEKALDGPAPSAAGKKYEEVRTQLQQQCMDLVGNISKMLQGKEQYAPFPPIFMCVHVWFYPISS